MHRMCIAIAATALALACGGCGASAPADDATTAPQAAAATHAKSATPVWLHGDAPYIGDVTASGDDGGRRRTRHGDASAMFEDLGEGRARWILDGRLDDGGGTGSFQTDGVLRNGAWASDPATVALRIADDGVISGGGDAGAQHLAFSGRVTASRLELRVEATPRDDAAGDAVPAVFDYRLTRRDPVREAARERERAESRTRRAADGGDGNRGGDDRCASIRYEMRNIAHIGEGSMSMIQVPVCVRE